MMIVDVCDDINTKYNKHIDKIESVKDDENLVMMFWKVSNNITLLSLFVWHISKRSLE